MPFTEAYLIQSHRAFKLSEHIAAQLDSIWATSTIGYYYSDATQGTLDRAYYNLWVLRFTEEGQCRSFTEWFMQAPSTPKAPVHLDGMPLLRGRETPKPMPYSDTPLGQEARPALPSRFLASPRARPAGGAASTHVPGHPTKYPQRTVAQRVFCPAALRFRTRVSRGLGGDGAKTSSLKSFLRKEKVGMAWAEASHALSPPRLAARLAAGQSPFCQLSWPHRFNRW